MYTIDTALESLRKYDITDEDVRNWEHELNLEIPVDEYGRKQYSPHHINLFKNVKKHLALGRTLGEIRQIIALPPLVESKVQSQARPVNAKVISKSPYAARPTTPALKNGNGGGHGAASVINLVQRLTKEKDQLYKKLLETEKLNSHLYSANNLFHKKVRDLTLQIQSLKESQNEEEKFKLLDDKDKLHKQLIASEKLNQCKDEEIKAQQEKIRRLEQQVAALSAPFDAARFTGDWMETGHLVEVVYDNFGINIEPERVRLFRISERPAQVYGNTAIINTVYQYETNSLWKRNETLTVASLDADMMEGQLVAEYILDGVPVAKAIYHVVCRRQKGQ